MDANIDLIMVDSLKRADDLIENVAAISQDLKALEDHLKMIAENTGRIARVMEEASRSNLVHDGLPF